MPEKRELKKEKPRIKLFQELKLKTELKSRVVSF